MNLFYSGMLNNCFANTQKQLFTLLLCLSGLAVPFYASAQTCTAPNQCMATPGFGDAPASHICPPDFIVEEIFLEDFDNGFGVFTEDAVPVGANDLTVSTAGDTPSFGTGPETTAGCNGSSNDGEFIFLEGSFTLIGETHCMSASIDIPAPSEALSLPFTMSFWHHMFGDNIGTMDVKINGGTEYTVTGQQQTANCQNWDRGVIDVSAHAGTTITMQICMSEGDNSISTFESDISIDHIQIFGCKPKNLPLPGWEMANIGTSNGDNCYFYDADNDEYTITSGGNNAISSTTDNVAFSYQDLCGNGSITAKIEDVSANGYGGIMLRDGLSAGAKQVSLFSNLSSVLRHESRSYTNAPKTVNAFYKPNPMWLKIERQGDWFFAYSSADGYNFQYVHAVYVPMGYCIQMGLASFTYSPTMTADAVFSNISTTGLVGGLSEEEGIAPVEAEVKAISPKAVVFPNPAQDQFTVRLAEPLLTDAQLVLRSGVGQVVGSRTLDSGNVNVDWNIVDLPSGIYYLEVSDNSGILDVLKVIKQ